jgi:hypothetical protein
VIRGHPRPRNRLVRLATAFSLDLASARLL